MVGKQSLLWFCAILKDFFGGLNELWPLKNPILKGLSHPLVLCLETDCFQATLWDFKTRN